ncbi:response regulator [Lysobacter sp. A6]|uniref:Response regulator n=1 Tax=Noviluteimonas lactosilytica TaxID=2888523 RepID=A0ABS8JKF8_9GAMM|nr:response regulator [Lysobacter lactosilyticus]MCC8364101.1 response regulator [Lysobacter lactosilyticus]
MNWLTDNAKGGFAMDATRAVVHVVDEDAEVRESLRAMLEPNGYDVRCHGSAEDFLMQWPMGGPGCVLLDVGMPGPSGLDLQLALAHRPDALPVVFLSGGGEIPLSVLAIRRSAADFLPKQVQRERLLASVGNAVARSQAQQALDDRRRQIRARFNTLTTRERAVFEQVTAGRLNKQIASVLCTCERTVKAHRANVMHKLQAHSVAELVRIAIHLEAEAEAAA